MRIRDEEGRSRQKEKLSGGLKWTFNTPQQQQQLFCCCCCQFMGPEEHFLFYYYNRLFKSWRVAKERKKEILPFWPKKYFQLHSREMWQPAKQQWKLYYEVCSTTRMSKYGLHLSYLRLLCQRERKKSPIQKKKRNGCLFQGAGLLTSSYCIVAAGMTNEGSRKSSVVIPGLS